MAREVARRFLITSRFAPACGWKLDGRVRSTNAGRVDVLDMVAAVVGGREIFADECEAFRRFAEGAGAGSV